jgi:hypothetical protein
MKKIPIGLYNHLIYSYSADSFLCLIEHVRMNRQHRDILDSASFSFSSCSSRIVVKKLW